ncbi:hypothetical protein [Labrys neptuniae]
MKKCIPLFTGLIFTISGCAAVDGSPWYDGNMLFLHNETPQTVAAYKDWVACGLRYVDSHTVPRKRFEFNTFSDPLAEAAVKACNGQQDRVMSQIKLDDFHKSWMARNYRQMLQRRHEFDQFTLPTAQ